MLTSQETILSIAQTARRDKKIIVTTNGCYDILHLGHVTFLEQLRTLGDIVIVLINSDASVQGFKGSGRPVLNQNERAEILCALRSVDYVVVFDENKPLRLLSEIQPHFHVKGGSFIESRIAEEKQLIESYGGAFMTLPMLGNLSTTHFMESLIQELDKERETDGSR